MICNENSSALPTIEFVAGETQTMIFHAFFHNTETEFDVSGHICEFAIANPLGAMQTIVSKQMTHTGNTLSVTLDFADTVDLCGKYVYQISIRDVNGNVEIPDHGVMYITRNIDKSF